MRYRVVVGSFKDKNHAALKARAVNAEAPDMQASVAERRPGNEFYAVVVGDYMPAAEAAALLIKKLAP